eukprot:365917-Chlamydomonas_euryale.AAC.20
MQHYCAKSAPCGNVHGSCHQGSHQCRCSHTRALDGGSLSLMPLSAGAMAGSTVATVQLAHSVLVGLAHGRMTGVWLAGSTHAARHRQAACRQYTCSASHAGSIQATRMQRATGRQHAGSMPQAGNTHAARHRQAGSMQAARMQRAKAGSMQAARMQRATGRQHSGGRWTACLSSPQGWTGAQADLQT